MAGEKDDSAIRLPFSNDGSFLENFKRLQDAKNSAGASQSGGPVAPTPIKLKTKPAGEKPSLKPCLGDVFENEDGSTSPASSAEYDQAMKLAKVVAQCGTTVEKISLKTNRNQPQFRFLFDSSLELCRIYRDKVTELSKGKVTSLAGTAEAKALLNENAAEIPKKRKRPRWVDGDNDNTSGADPPPEPPSTSVDGGGQMVDGDFMEQFKQSVAKAQLLASTNKPKKSALEYDSDEETEGGTWEHKLRAYEMQKTHNLATQQTTALVEGKHHLQDFLPSDRMKEILTAEEEARRGKSLARSDYEEQKLTATNIGYKMLARSGWKEGQGLGASGSGITAPVNKGRTVNDTSGLGASKPDEVTAGDTDYELYRKRMMMAYKFRPNPLNNPRRPY
ncbi:SURP and G-patch domain-containing protein 1-like [Oscarella lobularis]|uniref:SURP and G-patch domain-containing protein 1-like n=1 Tax=Oscarella lobularis TaxID=121494 RepID=UPI0033132170